MSNNGMLQQLKSKGCWNLDMTVAEGNNWRFEFSRTHFTILKSTFHKSDECANLDHVLDFSIISVSYLCRILYFILFIFYFFDQEIRIISKENEQSSERTICAKSNHMDIGQK